MESSHTKEVPPTIEHDEKVLSDIKSDAVVYSNAREAGLTEHTLSISTAFKKYPMASFCSVMVSTSIIMKGYDIVLVGSLIAQPAFARRYGELLSNRSFVISGPWQSALSTAPTIGAIFGTFLNGYLTTHFGYRKVLLAFLTLMTAFVFVLFFATSVGVLVAGRILCGVPWGVFAIISSAYASEVCHLALRGYLSVYVNLCWAVGQLVAAGVLRGVVNGTTEWAYRIPFAIQWAWPTPLVTIIFFAPEPPWWLVNHGKHAQTIKSITRLSNATKEDARRTVALITHARQIEAETETGTSYPDCFKWDNLRRTEIVCMVFAGQIWCGQFLGGMLAYFFVQAGLSPDLSFDFLVGGLALAGIGTIVT